MPKASRQTASDSIDGHGFEGHYEDFEGGYTVGFETFTEDVDLTSRLKGLPGDTCGSAHWGYVLKGKLTYRMRDRDEVLEGGDAFYVPPEHTVIAEAGTEVVFFSPSAEWHDTAEKIAKLPASAHA
jgi:cupin domain